MSEMVSARFPAMVCGDCGSRFYEIFEHPILGPVCPACLREPFKGRKRPATSPSVVSGLPPGKSHRIGRHSKTAAKRWRKIEAIAVRDGWDCHLCGGPLPRVWVGTLSDTTLDHVIPASLGGGNAMANLKLAHQGCNTRRGNALFGPHQ